ncbi:MAG TPA: exodeoxyribonuclease VII large subunit [Ilumatobacteraceae bacterium]|nr:exodeoxyribonuclease VII large subunit [Ilumatobacteraceae bacterium]
MSQVAFDFDLDDGGVPTYSVGELAEAINSAIRRRFTDGVWVRGEIQGWSERGPHAYFRLVEDTEDGKAAINIQFFANARMRLRPILNKHRLRLGDGLKVRIFGHLDYFAPSGQLGLKMSGLDPRFTLGEMALERDDVVRRLVASGLFDANRSVRVPAAPLRVGVVTSTASAAWGDFTHELDRSGLAFSLRVIDVRVQGEWAVDMVSSALRTLTRHDDLDVVVLIRGGGSKTELATFDHESIAIAIAKSPLPVFTGLGHEIDRSVADEVAHSSLKTPTACAAALVEHVYAFRTKVELVWSAIDRHANRALQDANTSLTALAHGVRRATVSGVERSDERLAHRRQRLGAAADRALERATDRLDSARTSLGRVPARLEPELRHLDAVASRVRLLDPEHTMARGWSITRDADGNIVRSADSLAAGATLITTFAKGSARSRVEETST